MPRVWVCLVGVFVSVGGLVVPAQGAASAPVPPRDFVVAGGAAGSFLDISVDASSEPLGGDPSGGVSFVVEVVVNGNVARVTFAGPVTCLAVDGNRAVIGFQAFIGPMKAVLVDHGSTGSPTDEFGVSLGSNCLDEAGVTPVPLSFGDVMVRDAPSKAQCRQGGWRGFTDAAGLPFKNQGRCLAFAQGVA